jgi:hypothetical protein
VRSFFEEGGKRLYVSRVFSPVDANPDLGPNWSGYANGALDVSPSQLQVYARFPGKAGNARVSFTFKASQNILVNVAGAPAVRALTDRDVVSIRAVGTSPPAVISDGYYLALKDREHDTWAFSSTGDDLSTADVALADLNASHYAVYIITVTVTIDPLTGATGNFVAPDLPLDPKHERAGNPDSMFAYFAEEPASMTRARTNPIMFLRDEVEILGTGIQVLQIFLNADPHAADSPPAGLDQALHGDGAPAAHRTLSMTLSHGDDGNRPVSDAYKGEVNPITDRKTGLMQLEDLEDISIVAAPGSTFGYQNAYQPNARSIVRLLISHAERMKYRIAVIDCGDKQSISEVRAMRAELDSTYGALYYPWIRVLDPLTQQEIHVPPSGFVAGIYARNDVNRAVYKAPANEVVNLALGFERFLNKAQQEVLNPEGINCFRFFEGRGMRLWGARTISSDPEWKFVNLRRYFAYLERSIDKGTQWAVFEPNGAQLWANVRRTIEDFLLNEWQNGALLGDKPDKAFFVKCDRSTMSQNDLDNGRMICLVGLAPLRPAEFVIFRIGQWTADRKV